MLITMPQLGETVTEGTILRWYKSVGDEVAEDEPLFEVSTDKVDSEVPSPVAGTLTEIRVAEGATVAIGTELAVVTPVGGEQTTSGPAAPPPARTESVEAPSTTSAPLGARVTRTDVEHRLAARARPLTELARTAPTNTAPVRTPAAPPTPGHDDSVVPFTSVRRRTAEHMVRSLATSAHTLVVMEVDYSAVQRARDASGEAFRAAEEFGLSYLPFIARAVIDAIAEFPQVNATVGDDALLVHRQVHLGVAVDLDFEGLVVPVVRDASSMRLRALARAIHDRAVSARERQLTADDLTGGTFTLTNAGGYGTILTAPIIAQPQVAIISTDGVAMRPIAVPADTTETPTYGIAVRPVGNLSLSFDHRAFDGAYASAFLRRVVELLTTRDWTSELT